MPHHIDLRQAATRTMTPEEMVTVQTDHGVYNYNGAQLRAAAALVTARSGSIILAIRDLRALTGWGLANAKVLVEASQVISVIDNIL